jgi:hypothetical protein
MNTLHQSDKLPGQANTADRQEESGLNQMETKQGREMSSIEQLLSLENNTHPRADDLLAVGFSFLDNRQRVLTEVNAVILRESIETAGYYNRHIQWSVSSPTSTASVDGDSLEPLSTVSRYAELAPVVSQEVRELWEVGKISEEAETTFERVFEWNFDRLKRLESSPGIPQVDIARRYGTLNSLSIPYPVHTHIDVPYAMKQAGLLRTPFSLYVAFAHDSIEEGRNLIFSSEEAALLEEVSAETFRSDFPEAGLGDRLAIAVRVLTESTFNTMVDALDPVQLEELERTTGAAREQAQEKFSDREERIYKIAVKDPMVFGGLASQIPLTVKYLLRDYEQIPSLARISEEHRLEIATSIIATEIGDRLSDMATLEGDIEWFVEDARVRAEGDHTEEEAVGFAVHKITAYAARLINMHEKLTEAISFFPQETQELYKQGMDLYLGTLVAKVSEIDSTLRQYHHSGLTISDIQEYSLREFQPAQRKAEEIFAGFVDDKVRQILSSGM